MQDSFTTFDTPATGILTGAQFGAGAIGTTTSTKSYDTLATGTPAAVGPGGPIGGPLIHDLGRGLRLKFYAQITTAVTSAGAATVQVNFACADDAALVTNIQALLVSEAVAKAALVAGYRYRHGSTPGVVPRRFVGAQIVIAAAALTAGAYCSGLMLDVDDHADVLG